jgi:TetR/AcrR family fatty acid metabolism transcriptional regulator
MKREFLKVFLLQLQLTKRFYGSKAYESIRGYFRVIEGVIEEGKLDGSFRSDVNARVFRNMFLGTFSHMALRWLILGQGTDKMGEIDHVTNLMSEAVLMNHVEK